MNKLTTQKELVTSPMGMGSPIGLSKRTTFIVLTLIILVGVTARITVGNNKGHFHADENLSLSFINEGDHWDYWSNNLSPENPLHYTEEEMAELLNISGTEIFNFEALQPNITIFLIPSTMKKIGVDI